MRSGKAMFNWGNNMGGNKSFEDKNCLFCTIVGQEYVFKALSLYNSLKKCSRSFHIWICCVDDNAYSILNNMKLSDATVFKSEDLRSMRLLVAQKTRKKNEYCWTLKAPLIKYVLKRYNVPSVIYCDSDMYFFSDPAPVFEEWGTYSVLLCPQRDLEWVHNKYGYYQAGFIGFKNDGYGLRCLEWWEERCLEWCYQKEDTDNQRWGDQKYLDFIPSQFSNIKILNHLGVDAAPWNIIYNNDYKITEAGNKLYVENYPLIAYHFACIAIFNENEYDLWTFNNLSMKSIIKEKIYIPYIESLRDSIQTVKKYKRFLGSFFSSEKSSTAKTYFRYSELELEMARFDEYYCFCTIVSTNYLLRAIALYNSLKKNTSNFKLWMCCIDDLSYSTLSKMNLKNAVIMQVQEIEDRDLLEVKKRRTETEYCWTLKAPLVIYLTQMLKLNHVIYCDADIYFFKDPKVIFDEWKNYSIFMCTQRGTESLEYIHGRYQAGLLGFKRDYRSLDILNWWKKKCLEWCSSEAEPSKERWGDQKYLDKVPNLFTNIKIIENPGINAAPWNLVFGTNYEVSKAGDDVLIDGNPLVVYHFGSMIIYNETEYDLWKLEPMPFSYNIANTIYAPYVTEIKNTIELLKRTGIDVNVFMSRENPHNAKNYLRVNYLNK
jgi:hypothetical protein